MFPYDAALLNGYMIHFSKSLGKAKMSMYYAKFH